MRNDGWFGNLIKVLWHDGLGTSLYAKRLERGRFIWPSPADGVIAISPAQLGYLLEGIEMTLARPLRAGGTRFAAGAPIVRDDGGKVIGRSKKEHHKAAEV